jgi:hypothetical protein
MRLASSNWLNSAGRSAEALFVAEVKGDLLVDGVVKAVDAADPAAFAAQLDHQAPAFAASLLAQ